MNAKQLNTDYPIDQFLVSQNFYPVKIKGSSYWYLSMIKEEVEKTASFKVDANLNVWYDHSIGKGGNLVDLACLILRTTDIKFVLSELNVAFSSFQQQPYSLTQVERLENQPSSNSKPKIEVTKTEKLTNLSLIQYLENRGISKEVSETYCEQVTYLNGDRTFYSIGFKNTEDGYELRGEGFKACSSPKAISFFDNGFDKVAIFEGFTDFLSYQMLPDFQIENSNWLILNSLSFLSRITSILLKHRQLFLFLDNDSSGCSAVAKIAKLQLSQVNMAVFYNDFKDLNEYLLWTKEKC